MHLQPLMSQMASTAADARGTRNFVTRAHGAHVSSEPSGGTRTTKKQSPSPRPRCPLCESAVSPLQDTRCSPQGAAFPLWGIELGSPSLECRVLSAGDGVPSLCPSSGRCLPSAEHMVPSAGHKVPVPWCGFPSSEHKVPTSPLWA